MNISSLECHASKCDIKAKNSSTLCKFHKGKKGLRLMDLMLTYILGVGALMEACYVTDSGRHDAVGCHLVYQELEIRFKPREMVILYALHEK